MSKDENYDDDAHDDTSHQKLNFLISIGVDPTSSKCKQVIAKHLIKSPSISLYSKPMVSKIRKKIMFYFHYPV